MTFSAMRGGVPLPMDAGGATNRPIELASIDTVQFAVRANGATGTIRQLSIWIVDAARPENGIASKPRSLISVDQPIRTASGIAEWEALYTLDVRESLGNQNHLSIFLRGRLDYVDGRSLELHGAHLVAGVSQVNLHIVAMQNDDGSMAAQVQPSDFTTLIARTNRSFRSTGIQLAVRVEVCRFEVSLQAQQKHEQRAHRPHQ